MPDIVEEFARELRFTGNPYIFGLATCGECPGGALFRLKEVLEAKGRTLSAGFVFVMPENFIGPVDLMGDAPVRQEKYTKAKNRIPGVAAAIRDRKISDLEGRDPAFLKFGAKIISALMNSVYNTPGRFHATAACNHCRTCERVCPTRNIEVTDDCVRWNNSCTQCYACIHWCPKEAIEIGGRTKGKPRYHHPDVTIADMMNQRGG
jgi:ferredoxin